MELSRLATRIVAYESGALDEDEAVQLFQDLLDTGFIYHLQGCYHRTLAALIRAGLVRQYEPSTVEPTDAN